MKTNLSPLLTIALVALTLSPPVLASPPEIIHHQGRVTSGGVNFNGAGSFRFALVDQAGTTTYWSNDGTSVAGSQPTTAVPLTVSAGLYSLGLGDTSLTGMTASIPASVFANNAQVYLRIWFDDGTNGSQQLSPDQRLTSVGYAHAAASLDGLSIDAPNFSFAFGENTIASGLRAAAWGDTTTAGGNNSTAWGTNTNATAIRATAFGNLTTASANNTTAFGANTLAQRTGATAWGNMTTAGGTTNGIGDWATAWGQNSEASQDRATAFGIDTVASGFNTTAFGARTTATVGNATAFGADTSATNQRATAWGNTTSAGGQDATAFGANTQALRAGATAWGDTTTAGGTATGVGDYATAWGKNTAATEDYATAFGEDTRATNQRATAWGEESNAFGQNSTAFGSFTTASGTNATAWGSYSNANGTRSTAWGRNTDANGENATTFGNLSTADGENSTAFGLITIAGGDLSTAFGRSTNAESFAETVLGAYDTSYTPDSTTTWDADDRLFVVGNGTAVGNRNDALVILKNGDTTLDGDLTTTGDFKYATPQSHKLQVPCEAFIPRSDLEVYNVNTGVGFMNPRSTVSLSFEVHAPVYLPVGATVTNVSFHVYDNEAATNIADFDGTLNKRTVSTGFSGFMAGVFNQTTTGQSTAVQVFNDNTISSPVISDDSSYFIKVRFEQSAIGNPTWFYGATVEYTLETVAP